MLHTSIGNLLSAQPIKLPQPYWDISHKTLYLVWDLWINHSKWQCRIILMCLYLGTSNTAVPCPLLVWLVRRRGNVGLNTPMTAMHPLLRHLWLDVTSLNRKQYLLIFHRPCATIGRYICTLSCNSSMSPMCLSCLATPNMYTSEYCQICHLSGLQCPLSGLTE